MEKDDRQESELSHEDVLMFLGDGFDEDDYMEVGSDISNEDRMNYDIGDSADALAQTSSSSKSYPKAFYKTRSKQKDTLHQVSRTSRGIKSPKNDGRENYPHRIVAAMNTVDFDEIFTVIQELCTPSVVMHVNRETPQPEWESKLFSTHIQGPVNVSKYLFGLMTLDPDSVVELKEVKFNPKSPDGVIVFKTEYTATKMYNISTTMDVLSPAVSCEELQAQMDPPVKPVAEDIVKEIDSIRHSLPIRKKPISVLSANETFLHTNKDNKLILKVVMNVNMVENDLSLEEA